jgi:hypothetical protein
MHVESDAIEEMGKLIPAQNEERGEGEIYSGSYWRKARFLTERGRGDIVTCSRCCRSPSISSHSSPLSLSISLHLGLALALIYSLALTLAHVLALSLSHALEVQSHSPSLGSPEKGWNQGVGQRRTHEWSEASPMLMVTYELPTNSGGNVRVVVVTIKDVGRGGSVAFVIYRETPLHS